MILDRINNPNDLNKLTLKEKKVLAKEIREFLIDKVSKSGGHFASNMGVVELTIALLSSFDFDKDKVIFDVGHQSYVYKILTGRKDKFDTLRKYKGLRGFPYPKESKYDFFETGHSSTSISACLGMARARDIKGEDFNVVSVIGDGSISNGMSLEAINDLGYSKTKMMIILNDNGMSISENVGGISSYLSRISINEKYLKVKNKISHSLDDTKVGNVTSKVLTKIKDNMRSILVPSKYFEAMGLTYIGPIDGHDIALMTKVFRKAKKAPYPVLIHVITKKGKGYEDAMNNPDIYHAVGKFDPEKGVVLSNKESYSSAFGKAMHELGGKDERIVAITAAMKDGVGLNKFFEDYPNRSFDVGIAEEHAVTLAAGLAKEKMIPVLAIYSTFLQRGFDEMLHDVCMQNLHVIFALDRAGLVGADGETHQGTFDLSYLSLMPNMIVICPKCTGELSKCLEFAVKQNCAVAIRYPRGGDDITLNPIEKISLGKWEVLSYGEKTAIIATGKMVQEAIKAKEEYNLNVKIINAIFVKPVDVKMLEGLVKNNYNILVMEDGIIHGGLYSMVLEKLNELGYDKKVERLGFDDKFIEQGDVPKLYSVNGISNESIKKIVDELNNR
jgi:1-deoxy-D-xylulose-5-phosphate synthase